MIVSSAHSSRGWGRAGQGTHFAASRPRWPSSSQRQSVLAARHPVTGSDHRCPGGCGQWWPRPFVARCGWKGNGQAPGSGAGAGAQMGSYCEPTPTSSKPHRSPNSRGSLSLPRRAPCSPESPQSRPKPGHTRPSSSMPRGHRLRNPMSKCQGRGKTMSESWLGCCSPSGQDQGSVWTVGPDPPSQSTNAAQVTCSLMLGSGVQKRL